MYKFFSQKTTFYILASLNILIGFIIFNISSRIDFPDAKQYWLLGESILHGKFSSWYFLPTYYPETLRTPGYPLFLSICQIFSKSEFLPKCIQLLLYFISVYIVTLIIKKLNPKQICINLFLLLLLPNIQVVYYTGYISAEILNVFFIVLTMYLILCERTIINIVLLAFSCYAAFIIRPVFLLFPFIIVIYFLIKSKRNFKSSVLFLFIYLVLLIPFGTWNKLNHDYFKITTLEGGAGVAHLGFWSFKLPDGYTEKYYWGNAIVPDIINPFHYSSREKAENVIKYEKECGEIFAALNSCNTREDSLNLVKMKSINGVFPLHNSIYTIKREKMLWRKVILHIKEEPLFYFKTRLYSLFRVYFTGINLKNYYEAKTLLSKLKIIYPFLITFIFIFIGLLFISFKVLFFKTSIKYQYLFLALFWYYGFCHMLFSIQARYTIPVHLLIISFLSLTLIKREKHV